MALVASYNISFSAVYFLRTEDALAMIAWMVDIAVHERQVGVCRPSCARLLTEVGLPTQLGTLAYPTSPGPVHKQLLSSIPSNVKAPVDSGKLNVVSQCVISCQQLRENLVKPQEPSFFTVLS